MQTSFQSKEKSNLATQQKQNYNFDIVEAHKNSEESRAICRKFSEYEKSGYKLYAMTLTYKLQSKYKDHTPDSIKHIFLQFYRFNLLQTQIFKSKYWHKKKPHLEPFLYCFIEEHCPKKSAQDRTSGIYAFPDRLHHHAIMAAHPDTVELFDKYLGEDTFKPLHSQILTSCFKESNSDWAFYAAKNYKKFEEDWLIFGPSSGEATRI